MPLMIGNRDDVVRTTHGHVIWFHEGAEKLVPDIDEVVSQCLSRGHVLAQKVKAKPVAAKVEVAEPEVEADKTEGHRTVLKSTPNTSAKSAAKTQRSFT